ncbi:MAG TPA: hypothetical protein DCO68_13255 [Methylophilaceae bacterium]|nr:hypothetical protein [Methylophilaceae bacterium]
MKNQNVLTKTIAACLFLLSYAPTVPAENSKLTFTTGLDYSTGKYGKSEKTEIKYIPFTGKYEYDRWMFKLTVPWLEIDGPGGVTGDSKLVVPNSSTQRSVESGLGDVIANSNYTFLYLPKEKFMLDIGGKVKFATASKSKGLGTGKNDYSIYIDAYKTLDRFTLLSTLGYKIIGDTNDYDFNNVWYGTLGAIYKVNTNSNLGLLLDLRQATWEYNTNIREYTLYYSHHFNSTYGLQSYITTGDTKSSVDLSGGLMLSVNF